MQLHDMTMLSSREWEEEDEVVEAAMYAGPQLGRWKSFIEPQNNLPTLISVSICE